MVDCQKILHNSDFITCIFPPNRIDYHVWYGILHKVLYWKNRKLDTAHHEESSAMQTLYKIDAQSFVEENRCPVICGGTEQLDNLFDNDPDLMALHTGDHRRWSCCIASPAS